jgi:hypothetical protein
MARSRCLRRCSARARRVWPGRGCRAAGSRRSGCGGLRRQNARPRPRCWPSRGAPPAARRLQVGRLGRDGCLAAGLQAAGATGSRAPDRFSRGALGMRLMTLVGAHRALDAGRGRSGRMKSSSDANQPSKPWPLAQRRSSTFMAVIIGRRRQAQPPLPGHGRKTSAALPQPVQADEGLHVGQFAAPRPGRRARLRSCSTVSTNSPASRRAGRPAGRARTRSRCLRRNRPAALWIQPHRPIRARV